MRSRLFFFYGTLTQDHDTVMNRQILPFLQGGRPGFVRGRLLALRAPGGWYPLLEEGAGRVWGRLYRAGPGFSARHLRMLDSYEAYDPRRPSRSEYVRRRVRVTVRGEAAVLAEAYVHNRPAHCGLRAVPGGNFARHAARLGLKVWGSEA